MLFVLYHIVKYHYLQTTVYCSIWELNYFESMHRTIQPDLDVFIKWCDTNGLKTNSDKTKAMIASTNSRLKTLVNVPKFKIDNHDVLI